MTHPDPITLAVQNGGLQDPDSELASALSAAEEDRRAWARALALDAGRLADRAFQMKHATAYLLQRGEVEKAEVAARTAGHVAETASVVAQAAAEFACGRESHDAFALAKTALQFAQEAEALVRRHLGQEVDRG